MRGKHSNTTLKTRKLLDEWVLTYTLFRGPKKTVNQPQGRPAPGISCYNALEEIRN